MLRRVWVGIQQCLSTHDKPGCADTALERGVFEERLLDGVQLIGGCESFHGFDGFALSLYAEDEA